MSRHFRPWTIDQTQLLPAAVVDYAPADHLAQFVVALAREHLDLSEIVASYKSGLGHGLTQSMSDCPQLVPLVDAVRANLGRKPREISADAGYCGEDNLLALATRKIHAHVATGRAKHPAETTREVGDEMTQKMRQKLKRAGYRSRYRLRKQIVEPVFGQIKQARGFRQFLLRGLEAVQAEWALICTAHNITKLAKAI